MKKASKMFLLSATLFLFPTALMAEETEKQEVKTTEGDTIYIKNTTLQNWSILMTTYKNQGDKTINFVDYIVDNPNFQGDIQPFEDIEEENWFYKDTVFLYRYGLVKGKGDVNTFKPTDNITRAEVATILSRMEKDSVTVVPKDTVLKDVPKEHWAYTPIMKLRDNKVMTGYEDGSFKPESTITRAEFVSMLERLFQKDMEQYKMEENIPDLDFMDVKKDDWYYQSLKRMAHEIGMSGYEDGTFKPTNEITRAEASTLVARYFVKMVEDDVTPFE